jgi:ATP-dependent Clp protease ATP-binding subunit ClpX
MAELQIEHCSFCHKHKDTVQKLIVSESVAICNECVDLCQELLDDQGAPAATSQHRRDPQDIKKFLDQYVIGQQHAKIVLCVAVVNHYKRLSRSVHDPDIAKANILMLGPTGSGKTLLARSIAKYLDLPFAIADATSITEAGYVGDDVETLITRLYSNSGYDIERTQKGIVFIDEIDKISRRSESVSVTRDVSGEGVQQALLKLVEGTVCRVPTQSGRKHPTGDVVEIDTRDILFIAGGAFVGLESMIARRQQGTSMGFHSRLSTPASVDLSDVIPDDLMRFGMIPEFIGRFPVTVALQHLTDHDLRAILTDVKHNLIEQYQWLMRQDQIELTFRSDALDCLVQKAQKSGTGARGLHSELEKVMMPHMYAVADYQRQGIKSLEITAEHINNVANLQGEICNFMVDQ